MTATVVASLALASLVPPAEAGADPRSSRTRDARRVAVFEHRIVEWMNAVRQRHDVRRLRVDRDVARYARRHSERMADGRNLVHSSTTQLEDLLGGTRWSMCGENIGYGSLRQLKRLWLASAEHRANILNGRYDHVGVGVAITPDWVWATVVFYG